MALVGHRGWAVNDMGNVQPAAAVEVRRVADNSLASLFTDDTGGAPVANPTVADAEGSFEFYLEPDRYTLLVGSGASQEAQPLNIVDGRAQVPFESRADFVAWVAGGGVAADGTIKSDGTVQYVASAGATSIADLPGWLPFGVIYFEHFGAKGDGVRTIGGAITSGTTTLTDATASFTSADVGKLISIGGTVSTPGAPTVGTIASVNSATSLETSVTAPATQPSGFTNYTYGSDDTAAFQAAIDYITELRGGVVNGMAGKIYCLNGRVNIPKRNKDNPYLDAFRRVSGNGALICQIKENEPMFKFKGATVRWDFEDWFMFYNSIQDAANTQSICITASEDAALTTPEAEEIWTINAKRLRFENCFSGIASWPGDTNEVLWWAGTLENLYGIRSRGSYLRLGGPTTPGTQVRMAIRDCSFFGWVTTEGASVALHRYQGVVDNVEVLRHQNLGAADQGAWYFDRPNGTTLRNCRTELCNAVDDGAAIIRIEGGSNITIESMDFSNLVGDAGAGNEAYVINNDGANLLVIDPEFTGSTGVTANSGDLYFLHHEEGAGADDRGTIRYRMARKGILNSSVKWVKADQAEQRIEPVEMDLFTFSREVVLADEGTVVDMDETFIAPYDGTVAYAIFNCDASWDSSTAAAVDWFPLLDRNGSQIWSMAANSGDRARPRIADVNNTGFDLTRGDALTARLNVNSGTDNAAYPLKARYVVGIIRRVGHFAT